MPPSDRFYGDRNAVVKDRTGIVWVIATHVEDVAREELKRREAEAFKQMMTQRWSAPEPDLGSWAAASEHELDQSARQLGVLESAIWIPSPAAHPTHHFLFVELEIQS